MKKVGIVLIMMCSLLVVASCGKDDEREIVEDKKDWEITIVNTADNYKYVKGTKEPIFPVLLDSEGFPLFFLKPGEYEINIPYGVVSLNIGLGAVLGYSFSFDYFLCNEKNVLVFSQKWYDEYIDLYQQKLDEKNNN